ncbi:hypothetical protein QUF58_13040 [Anaerolineales bacterium HSG24]|nr:hypothetical protein [Anaerolineales bacterium HSG24]
MNTTQIKQLIRQELPLIIREDNEMRQFIIDLSRHQYANKDNTEDRFERMMKKLEENQKRSDKRWKEYEERSDRRWKEYQERSDKRWKEYQAELHRLREESERKWQEYRAETNQRFEKIDERFEKIDERFEKIDERFEKMDERFEKLEHDGGVLKGYSLEQRCRNNAPAIFGRHLIRGKEATNKIYDRLYEAHANGEISESQYAQVDAVDLLWEGKLRTTQTEMVLVIEISWKIAMHDVNRAIERAEILQQIGFNTLPVVIGREWDEATKQADVVQVVNGSVKRDSWLRTIAKIKNVSK